MDESAVDCGRDALDGVFPMEADAEADGAVEEDLVKDGAADAAAGRLGEGGLDGEGIGKRVIADEADAAQEMIFGFTQDLLEIGEADGCKGFERVGHEAFAAGFIDGGLHGVDDLDVKALAGCGDGRGQSGWTSSDYQDITNGPASVHLRLPFLPFEQNELGTEGGAHCGEDAVGSGLAGGVDEYVFEDGENRGCGEIADFTQASPRGFESVGREVEGVFHGFEDFWAPGVEDVARNVI
jgi:hypothetical protein